MLLVPLLSPELTVSLSCGASGDGHNWACPEDGTEGPA